MIKIKESSKKRLFGKISRSHSWLTIALNRTDALGRKGIDLFNKHEIQIVKPTEKADIGFSLHGDPVSGLPQNKTILFKGEPPIYYYAYGRKLNTPFYIKKFLATMSNTIFPELDQVHFNSPQETFIYHNQLKDQPKDRLLCTILKNKYHSYLINSFHPTLHKYNRHSLHKYRKNMDLEFCHLVGPKFYHSYGSGWLKTCFQGSIPVVIEGLNGGYHEMPPRLLVLSSHKFNFCPENSRFNGYVTEKPIQAMVAGSIPLYLGAPDVESYLPTKTFINLEDYSVTELCEELLTLSDKTRQQYLENINKFLTSSKSDHFSSYVFAKKLIKIIEDKL